MTGLAVRLGVATAKDFVKKLARAGDESFQKARRELYEDYLIELNQRVEEQFAYLVQRVDEVGREAWQRIEDPSCVRVAANYARAADAEAIEERRRMLAYAEAALIDTRLTLAQHARLERLLRELDPEDVLWLNVIDRVAGTFFDGKQVSSEQRVRWEVWSKAGADILAGSGCVRITHVPHRVPPVEGPPGWDVAEVTREGRLVLHGLRLYARARPSPTVIPGHEQRTADCSEADAWERVDAIPSLRSDAIRLSGSGEARYDFPKVDYRNGTPRPHDAQATLRIREVPAEQAEAVSARAPVPGGWVNRPGMPTDQVVIDAPGSDVGTAGKRVLQIHGPHDVLRWLADEVDARWQ